MGEVVELQRHSTKEDLLKAINDIPDGKSFMLMFHDELPDGEMKPTFTFVGDMHRDTILLSTYKLQHYLLRGA